MRQFKTGATRDDDGNKLDFEGFLSPLALERYGEYMHQNRKQSDGELRASDNWQNGIPLDAYMKSGWRHFRDWWMNHRGYRTVGYVGTEEALCALLFNANGYLHETLKARGYHADAPIEDAAGPARVLDTVPLQADASTVPAVGGVTATRPEVNGVEKNAWNKLVGALPWTTTKS